MNVLSLFDGMSCGQITLERLGIKVSNYFASEIDKYALKVTQTNYPNTIQLGDITKLDSKDLPKIDLLLGGSPCQSLSIASGQKESGLVKGKSILFWEFVRLFNEVKPKYFLFENVASMQAEDKDTISAALGVQPIMINSALVSAQSRKRLYWTNLKVTQPEDKCIYLKDILEERELRDYCVMAPYNYTGCSTSCYNKPIRIGIIGKGGQGERIYHIDGKSVTLSANGGGRGAKTGLYKIKNYVRKLTPLECERLQTVSEGYTDCDISDAQRYKMLGNGWTIDVITHILGSLK